MKDFKKSTSKIQTGNHLRDESFNHKKNETILLFDNHGLSHYTAYLAYGLSKYKNIMLYGFSHEDYVITGAATQNKIKFYNIEDKLPRGHSVLKIIVRSLLLFFILFRAFFNSKFDIVHIQGHLPMFFFFIPILKLKRKRIFWTIHDVSLRPSNKGIRGKLDSMYTIILSEPALLRKYADMIIVHGQSLKNQLSAKGVGDKKIHVIPHFDYRFLLNNLKKEHSGTNERKLLKDYVLFFGRVAPYKGFEILISASRIVRKHLGHEFILLIAGEGDISIIKSHMSNDDYKYINLLNRRIPYSEIPDLLYNAKFLILPYSDASQSGVIPLAYTFSKPVIVSNVGALGEYVEHEKTGLIFESGNKEQLAEYTMKLIKNKNACIEMGEKANQKLLKDMSLELCCDKLNYLYDMN